MLDDPASPELACVILAHHDPHQVHRLVEALSPLPVLVHVDARADDAMFEAITAELPSRAVVLPRRPTAWATWGAVEAEIEGYRAALAIPGITHVALLSGADYPTSSVAEIRDLLRRHRDDSFVVSDRLPYSEWGRSGGLDRLRYRHWARGKRMLRLPIPRALPRGIVFAGGSSSKILAVDHARRVVDAYEKRPDLVRFWRRTWSSDETFVVSVLSTPELVPGYAEHSVNTHLWWIDWDGPRKKSPPFLTVEQLPELLLRRWDDQQEHLFLFARKFSTDASSEVMDALDAEFGLRPSRRVARP
jgi:hypothetical protein